MGDFSDITAYQYFEQADFFMPELLLKELCPGGGGRAIQHIVVGKLQDLFRNFLQPSTILKKRGRGKMTKIASQKTYVYKKINMCGLDPQSQGEQRLEDMHRGSNN